MIKQKSKMFVLHECCDYVAAALLLAVNRSKEYIGLNLSAVVWKALVGQEVHRDDLDGVDVLLTRSMQDIRTIDQKGESCNVTTVPCSIFFVSPPADGKKYSVSLCALASGFGSVVQVEQNIATVIVPNM